MRPMQTNKAPESITTRRPFNPCRTLLPKSVKVETPEPSGEANAKPKTAPKAKSKRVKAKAAPKGGSKRSREEFDD